MVAQMQGAYEKEAMGKESLKMETLSRCERRTDRDEPANYSVPTAPYKAVYGNLLNFGST